MKPSRSTEAVLGVTVASRTVHAVLVEKRTAGPVVVAQFTRNRVMQGPTNSMAAAMAGMVPELQDQASGSDFTLEFGDGVGTHSAGDLFLQGEFALDEDAEEAGDGEARGGDVTVELGEILDECIQLGYKEPTVIFCLASAHLAHVELRILADRKGGKGRGKRGDGAPKANELHSLLKTQYSSEVERDRVAFLPMASTADDTLRYMAIVAKYGEPVRPTLEALRASESKPPTIRGLETETSVLLGLTRTVVGDQVDERTGTFDNSAQARNTLLVRVGAEDTLVLFLNGSQLQHVESLKSLTSFDAPETICSRVLLQQDEQAIDEIHHVLLLGEDKETKLVESFSLFFPDADVRSVRRYLPELNRPARERSSEVGLVSALGAALRLVDSSRRPFFDEVNLLPSKLMRRAVRMPFGWQTIAMCMLIAVTGVFFFSRYTAVEREMDEYREKLRSYPPQIAVTDASVLQARIDSMQAAYSGYMRALGVLDTLLIGSDRWSRGLEALSRETAGVSGIWVESWRPKGTGVTLQGAATSRDRVVQLAERLNGGIHALSFSEVREWPVYDFTMEVPVPEKLPLAAEYLRKMVDPVAQTPATNGTPVRPATLPSN